MAVTMEDLRESLTLVNEHRKAQSLSELMLVNAVEPPGLAFLAMQGDGAMKQVHSRPMKRVEADCFLQGQLSVLSDRE